MEKLVIFTLISLAAAAGLDVPVGIMYLNCVDVEIRIKWKIFFFQDSIRSQFYDKTQYIYHKYDRYINININTIILYDVLDAFSVLLKNTNFLFINIERSVGKISNPVRKVRNLEKCHVQFWWLVEHLIIKQSRQPIKHASHLLLPWESCNVLYFYIQSKLFLSEILGTLWLRVTIHVLPQWHVRSNCGLPINILSQSDRKNGWRYHRIHGNSPVW